MFPSFRPECTEDRRTGILNNRVATKNTCQKTPNKQLYVIYKNMLLIPI